MKACGGAWGWFRSSHYLNTAKLGFALAKMVNIFRGEPSLEDCKHSVVRSGEQLKQEVAVWQLAVAEVALLKGMGLFW